MDFTTSFSSFIYSGQDSSGSEKKHEIYHLQNWKLVKVGDLLTKIINQNVKKKNPSEITQKLPKICHISLFT